MTRESLANIGVSRRMIPITGPLRTLLQTRMNALGIGSYRALAQRTGGDVSHGSVHRIMAGQQTSVRPRTLAVLAHALGTAPADLLAAAGVERSPWTLPEAFDGVDVMVRPTVERALAQLLEAGGIL